MVQLGVMEMLYLYKYICIYDEKTVMAVHFLLHSCKVCRVKNITNMEIKRLKQLVKQLRRLLLAAAPAATATVLFHYC